MNRNEIIARNIRARRDELGLTQKDVAAKADLSDAGYRNIESGKVKESRMDSLTRIAKVLDVPLMAFFEQPRELVSVRFRAQKKLRVRQRIINAMARWLEDFEFLEDLLDDHRPFKLSGLATKLEPYSGEVPRSIHAARLARVVLDLDPDEPIQDVVGLMEWAGVKVRMMKYTGDGFFGLSGWGRSYESPGVIVCDNDNVSAERKIFSAVHEMGHLILHRDEYNVREDHEDKDREKEADQFASHFLMPDDQFEEKWNELRGKSPYDRVMVTKKLFNVSYRTVLYRLAENDAIDFGDAQRYVYRIHRMKEGRKLGGRSEPYEIGKDYPFIARRLDNLVRRAIEEEQITVSRGAEILGISSTAMRQVMQDWDWALAG